MHAILTALVTGADGRWHPGIGDPTLMGWLTVVAYFSVAARCLMAWRHAASQIKGPSGSTRWRKLRLFWGLSAATMLLLGVNKQLDLQSLFTELARSLAEAQGWYEQRRQVQVLFVGSVFALGTTVTALLAYALRDVLAQVWVGVVGLGVIVAFVGIRAASFHHIDLLLSGPVHLNWLCELTGIGLVGLAAFRERAPLRRKGPTPTARTSSA